MKRLKQIKDEQQKIQNELENKKKRELLEKQMEAERLRQEEENR